MTPDGSLLDLGRPAVKPIRSHNRQAHGSCRLGEIKSAANLPPPEGNAGTGRTGKLLASRDVHYWRTHLLSRRYSFPASGGTARDFAAFISHANAGFIFPLGESAEEAAARAHHIYSMAVTQGWKAVCQQYSREMVVAFEWCMNPVLWTYATIHTLVGKPTDMEFSRLTTGRRRQQVLVAEPDDGIRRAICWSINQHPGFAGIPCNGMESFKEAMIFYKPKLIVANRSLAGCPGFDFSTVMARLQPGPVALLYSVYADGHQMIASAPGEADAYLIRRVKPQNLLDPVLRGPNRSEPAVEGPMARIKSYFREMLPLSWADDQPGLPAMTPREREVLELLGKGYVDKQIAHAMGISVWTVHGHLKKIFERLGVRSRTEAVIRFMER